METNMRTTASQFETLGKLAWLWMNSPLQRQWAFGSGARFLLPAVQLGQFELLERDGMPVAYCSWAWMDAPTELRYVRQLAGLAWPDWRSGDRLWIVDWVAPFGAGDSFALRRRMQERFPDHVARAVRVKRGHGRAHVMEFHGPGLEVDIARARLQDCHAEFLAEMASAEAPATAAHAPARPAPH